MIPIDFSMSDSFSAFKLHSNSPNSAINSPAAPKIPTISSLIQPHCICAHCTHLSTFNHHLGYVKEQGESNGGSQQSSRWSPTSAQLLYLEELYRQGSKTPTAEQIQQIASQLRRFGKIEGKNVFYWFQNHRARERQKRRRCETETAEEKQLEEEADQGLRGTGYEVKETKKWASTSFTSNCSGLAEVSAASVDIAEREANGWTDQFEVLRSKRREKQEAKFQNTKMPCFPSNYHLKSIITNTATIDHAQTSNPQNYYDEEIADTRTLELFPRKSNEKDGISVAEIRKDR